VTDTAYGERNAGRIASLGSIDESAFSCAAGLVVLKREDKI